MQRRRRHAEHENHERWLVSYADFITLLFAFFVVMFANSQVDKAKVAAVSESVRGALENGGMAKTDSHRSRDTAAPTTQNNRPKVDLDSSLAQLQKDFAGEIQLGKLQVEMTSRGLVVSMREAAFFPPADDRLNSGAEPILEKLARTLKTLPNSVRLEGHTDSSPIRSGRFQSNWQLSAARAIAVMELLTTRFDVPRNKVAIAGYADTIPLANNDTPEGRARNRRVDVVILNASGQSGEPAAAGRTEQKPSASR